MSFSFAQNSLIKSNFELLKDLVSSSTTSSPLSQHLQRVISIYGENAKTTESTPKTSSFSTTNLKTNLNAFINKLLVGTPPSGSSKSEIQKVIENFDYPKE